MMFITVTGNGSLNEMNHEIPEAHETKRSWEKQADPNCASVRRADNSAPQVRNSRERLECARFTAAFRGLPRCPCPRLGSVAKAVLKHPQSRRWRDV
jgi:hypothetical protein